MRWRKKGDDPHLPILAFLNKPFRNDSANNSQSKRLMRFGGRTVQNVVFLFLAIALTFSGVIASVAITIRGNSSSQNDVISLGVGKAQATSCNSDTQVKVNTVSDWDDTVAGVNGAAPGDFVLTQVNVTGVQSSCAANVMTLVIAFDELSDLTVTCTLPAAENLAYSSGTFVFPTDSEYVVAAGEYKCPSFSTGLLMSKIEAAAIQIK
jgi:hypothetical protein